MHTEETSGQLVIARRQLVRQLALLGYRKGDTVYVRAFYHKDDPRKTRDTGKKAEARSLSQLIKIIQGWQNEGRGVYLVVNGGGQCDKDIIQCRAIFYEHDDLDKEISRELWRSLKLPEPTFQVDTGGKSIHSYWVLDEAIDPVNWKVLQSDLLEYADADRALKNPSRVMRLAGGWHISPSKAFPSTIIAASGNLYSFDLLRAIVPVKQVIPVSCPDTKSNTLPCTLPLAVGNIPLQECLTLEQRHLIASGVQIGRRNNTGAALARNLIGTSIRLQYLGEPFSGEARQLFDNYCTRCSPPLDSKEAEQIWKSAKKDNPSATLTDDMIINCVKSWKRRQQTLTTNINNTSHSSSNITQTAIPVEVSLKERVLDIISRGLSPSEEKLALLELSKQVNIQTKEIEAVTALLRQEAELEQQREEREVEIRELLTVDNNSIDLSDFLPEQLSEPLKLWCKWLNLPESVALTAILTTVSTLHPVGTELIIHRAMDFSVPPILFSAVVGESGQKKSPVYRTLIKKPLRVLQNQATNYYKQQLTRYERDLASWGRSAGRDPQPTKPGLPVYFFTDATGEGIKTQAQETPNKAMFALIDELAGLFNSANQYRAGKGSDRQDMLSYYDGLGQTVLRASGIKVDVEKIYVSIFGGIQPDVLKEHTRDLKDVDGHWARFLFVSQPLAASQLPDDDTDINLNELLSGCYGRVASLPFCQYKLSPEAFKCYQQVYNNLEQKRVQHSQPGMRAVYSKMEGAIGRLALNLHAVEMSFKDNVVAKASNEISLETMNKAIALADFYTLQIKNLHAESEADKGELPALLAKLFDYASSKGAITLSQATRKFNAIKTTPQALDHFRELEAMKYGRVEKQKRNWVFIPNAKPGLENSCNGSQFLPGKVLERSCNDCKKLCNGSYNDCFESKCLSSNDFKLSCNDCNDFLELANPDDSSKEKTQASIAFIASLHEVTQKPTRQENTPCNGSYNAPTSDHCMKKEVQIDHPEQESVESLNPTSRIKADTEIVDTFLKPLGFSLKAGECIQCYPTERHAENKWEVSAIVTEIEVEESSFVGCTIQYCNKNRETLTTRISGHRADWILRKI